MVAMYVKQRFIAKGYTVLWEPRIRSNERRLFKPDLIAYNTEICNVCDVSIVSDGMHPDVPNRKKCEYYGTPDLIASYEKLSGAKNITLCGIIYNWRGAMSLATVIQMKDILSKSDLTLLLLRTLK